ncbi:phospholipase A2-like [Cochliomyia hominivorax]
MQRFLKTNSLCKTLIMTILIATQISALENSDKAVPIVNPHIGLTVPGTKWCGPGNTASSYEDLGTHRETDMCCRDHDHCEVILSGGSSLHGLSNNGLFPILECSCEDQFRSCLQNVNNLVANTLGNVYYSARKVCIAEGYPITGCQQYQKGTLSKRCVQYSTDETKPKVWQFYDMAYYSSGSNK